MLREQIRFFFFLAAEFVFIKRRWKNSFREEMWTRFPLNSHAEWWWNILFGFEIHISSPELILLFLLVWIPLIHFEPNIHFTLVVFIAGHETRRCAIMCFHLVSACLSWQDIRAEWLTPRLFMRMQTLPCGTMLFWVEGHSKENNNVSLAYLHCYRANSVLWDWRANSCRKSNKNKIKKTAWSWISHNKNISFWRHLRPLLGILFHHSFGNSTEADTKTKV